MDVGTRIRMVHTSSFGTVHGPTKKSPVDGGDRIPIKWDHSGNVTEWHPDFLMPASSDPAGDPNEVVSGDFVKRRERIYIDKNGVTVFIPGGLFKR